MEIRCCLYPSLEFSSHSVFEMVLLSLLNIAVSLAVDFYDFISSNIFSFGQEVHKGTVVLSFIVFPGSKNKHASIMM